MEDNVGTEGVMSKNHDTFSDRNRDKFVDKMKTKTSYPQPWRFDIMYACRTNRAAKRRVS